MDTRLRRYERRLYLKDLPDVFLRQDFRRGAVRDYAAIIKEHNLIGKPRRKIQIVNHTHGNYVSCVSELVHLFHKIDLMTDVQKRERLIEKQKPAARARSSTIRCGRLTGFP